jgi:hypothetical protein
MTKIKLNKSVYNKGQYEKTIDTSFSNLGVKTIQEELEEQPSVQEFFNLYNQLFYQIPELGDVNSHEFLIKTSGDYISFDENNELIESLQSEIATLREELLSAQEDLANFTAPKIIPPLQSIGNINL